MLVSGPQGGDRFKAVEVGLNLGRGGFLLVGTENELWFEARWEG